jgi:polar amino acid transport system substrate-binding protein
MLMLSLSKTTLYRAGQYFTAGIATMLLLACAGGPKQDIAPTGSLQVGLYQGSPTSYLADGTLADNRGIGFALGKQLSANMDVTFKPIVFPKNADVLDAVKASKVDLVFTNATPARAKFIQFSEPVIRLEKGFLLAPKSKIKSIQDLNNPNIKIGVSVGSSSEREVSELLSKAKLVKMNSTKETVEQLISGKIDAFSSNKGILFELSDQVPGSSVMPDIIGYESMALGVPIDRPNVKPFLDDFIQSLKSNGQLNSIISRSGLRGVSTK